MIRIERVVLKKRKRFQKFVVMAAIEAIHAVRCDWLFFVLWREFWEMLSAEKKLLGNKLHVEMTSNKEKYYGFKIFLFLFFLLLSVREKQLCGNVNAKPFSLLCSFFSSA